MTQHRQHRPMPGSLRHRLVAMALALSVTGGVIVGLPSLGGAQADGTGAATPLPPSQCSVVEAKADVGSSVATATPVASPVVMTGATPVAAQESVPVTNDPLLAELKATTNTLLACLNERNFETYASLTSDAFRGTLFGSNQPLEADLFVELASALPDVDQKLLDVTGLSVENDTTVSVNVTYTNAHQLHNGIWTFTRGTANGVNAWILDSQELLPIQTPAGTAVIDISFGEQGFLVNPESVKGPDVVLYLLNPTTEDHEALVLKLDDGVTTTSILQNTGASLPDGVTLIGQATVLPGNQGTMYLTNLAPGTYTIVDLLPDADGNPHLSSGMETTFTVEK